MKPYEGVPQDKNMRVLHNVLSIEGLTTRSIIIRSNITEEFWREVIAASQEFHVCALGTPGIGKTTSTCILIRLLLEQKRTVLYRVRTEDNQGYVYMFIPALKTQANIDVKVFKEEKFKFEYMNEEFNNPSIYYVVDPGQTRDNCNLQNIYQGKVIIVTSPDEGHWGGSMFQKKKDGVQGTFRFYPVWKLSELIDARPFLDNNFSEKDVIDRFEKVGGIPGHIFEDDEEEFSDILKSQTSAINKLNEDQLRKLMSNDMDSAHTFDKGQPNSLLMVYESSIDGNFRRFNVAVSSKLVLTKLLKKNSIFMWNLMVSLSAEEGGFGWKIFESICHNRMLGHSMEYFDNKYHDGTNFVGGRTEPLKLGGCKSIKGILANLITAAKQEEHVLFYSLDPKYPLFDFVYRAGTTFFAFQSTFTKKRNCDVDRFLTVAREVGGPSNFVFHYLTCDKNYGKFKLGTVKALEQLVKKEIFLIHVICIPRPDIKVLQEFL